jgi:HSP20 family protein
MRRERPEPAEWDPVAEFRDLHDRMGQLVARAFGDAARGPLPPWLPPWSPPADVSETGESYLVEIDLPGARREDVHVEVRDQELIVTGELGGSQQGHPWRRARPAGRFECRVTLPGPVDADRTTADLAAGVLTVTLPKAATARPRKVHITGG